MEDAWTYNPDISIDIEDINGKICHFRARKKIHLQENGIREIKVKVVEGFDRINKLLLESNCLGLTGSWYCEYIIVQDPRGSKDGSHRKIEGHHWPGIISDEFNGHSAEYYFPVRRWVLRLHKYIFGNCGVCLPKDDFSVEARRADIEKKREYYKLREVSENLAILVSYFELFIS